MKRDNETIKLVHDTNNRAYMLRDLYKKGEISKHQLENDDFLKLLLLELDERDLHIPYLVMIQERGIGSLLEHGPYKGRT